VLHGKGDPKALLRGMYFWTWNTEEVLAMIEWMRETVNINFGVLMPGTGAAWFDDLQLEIDGKPYDASEVFDFEFE
jgi:hypothetical protein